ncbi:MAG: hypothetical protein J3K34DRAFT_129954 [Monoraphidium minutum]|nr:MAG: hypothetical protein J3K34DRAFT_129954 [Monoraphidium minutum]
MSAADLELATWRRGDRGSSEFGGGAAGRLGGGAAAASAAASTGTAASGGGSGEDALPGMDGPSTCGSGWRHTPRGGSAGGWSALAELCGDAGGPTPGSCAGLHLSPVCSQQLGDGGAAGAAAPGCRVVVTVSAFSAVGLRQRLSTAGGAEAGPATAAAGGAAAAPPAQGVHAEPAAAVGAGRAHVSGSPFLQYNLHALDA